MPKLLSINNFHYRRAGSDALFLDHDRLFRSHGWETAVFAMRHPDNLASPWADFFVDELDFAARYSPMRRAAMAGKVLYSYEARTKIRQLLARYSPDVVHIHSVYHHISPAILPILGELGVPLVLTAHDYKLLCPAYKMFDGRRICQQCKGGSVWPLLRNRCIHGSGLVSTLVAAEAMLHRWLDYYRRHIDRIVCPSQFLLERFVDWGWPIEKLIHIKNFFDARLWTPQFAPGSYFLYFGRLAPEKGIATLLRASAIAGAHVKIVGFGPEKSTLQKLAAETGASAEFLEHLPPAALAPIIRGARAVILPSEWYENGPLSVLEAFACGKPVIASRIGGNSEMVADGSNGWLYEVGNAQALAERMKMVSLLPDDELKTIGQDARLFVERTYGAHQYFEKLSGLYSSLGCVGSATYENGFRPLEN